MTDTILSNIISGHLGQSVSVTVGRPNRWRTTNSVKSNIIPAYRAPNTVQFQSCTWLQRPLWGMQSWVVQGASLRLSWTFTRQRTWKGEAKQSNFIPKCLRDGLFLVDIFSYFVLIMAKVSWDMQCNNNNHPWKPKLCYCLAPSYSGIVEMSNKVQSQSSQIDLPCTYAAFSCTLAGMRRSHSMTQFSWLQIPVASWAPMLDGASMHSMIPSKRGP